MPSQEISANPKKLISSYHIKKDKIKERLDEFRTFLNARDEDIFSELCFCILTPQSKAVYCDSAINELKKSDLLLKGDRRAIKGKLKCVRFPNNKAAYLVAARESLTDGKRLNIKKRLEVEDVFEAREWLVKNIKGLGYKEASHFLRNIGLGKDLAILDTHILKNLKKYRVIKEIPPSLSKKTYLAIEGKMRAFSQRINIPMDELDLLFWSNQTGFIFK